MLNFISAITFNKEGFMQSLDILWKGLLAILVVILVVMIVTYLMQYISAAVAARKEKSAKKTDNPAGDGDEREL